MSTFAIIAAGGAILSAGSGIVRGIMGSDVDTEGAADAAAGVTMAEKQQLSNTIGLQRQGIDKDIEKIIGKGQKAGERNLYSIFSKEQEAIAGGDFAVSESTGVAIDRARSSVATDYKDLIAEATDAGEQKKRTVDLQKQKSVGEIEKRFQSTISSIAATPDTFFESMLGVSDYNIEGSGSY